MSSDRSGGLRKVVLLDYQVPSQVASRKMERGLGPRRWAWQVGKPCP